MMKLKTNKTVTKEPRKKLEKKDWNKKIYDKI